MIDFEDDYTSDYKSRDVKTAFEEARQMVDTILTPPDQTPLEVREKIARKQRGIPNPSAYFNMSCLIMRILEK